MIQTIVMSVERAGYFVRSPIAFGTEEVPNHSGPLLLPSLSAVNKNSFWEPRSTNKV
jgi:hypothetical protein